MTSLLPYQHYPFPPHHSQLSTSWALRPLRVGGEWERKRRRSSNIVWHCFLEDLHSWLPLLGSSVGSWAVEDLLAAMPTFWRRYHIRLRTYTFSLNCYLSVLPQNLPAKVSSPLQLDLWGRSWTILYQFSLFCGPHWFQRNQWHLLFHKFWVYSLSPTLYQYPRFCQSKQLGSVLRQYHSIGMRWE